MLAAGGKGAKALRGTQALAAARLGSKGVKLLRETSEQFLNEAAQNTGRFLAIETGMAVGAGAGRAVGDIYDLSPGGRFAVELLSGIAGGFGGAGAAKIPSTLLKKTEGKTATEVLEMVSDGTIKYEELQWMPLVKESPSLKKEITEEGIEIQEYYEVVKMGDGFAVVSKGKPASGIKYNTKEEATNWAKSLNRGVTQENTVFHGTAETFDDFVGDVIWFTEGRGLAQDYANSSAGLKALDEAGVELPEGMNRDTLSNQDIRNLLEENNIKEPEDRVIPRLLPKGKTLNLVKNIPQTLRSMDDLKKAWDNLHTRKVYWMSRGTV